MADLSLFSIQGDTSSLPEFARLGLYDQAREALKDSVEFIARKSLSAAKTFVPRRSRELQTAINLQRTAGNGDLVLKVVLKDGQHQNSKTPDQMSNVELADLLDEGNQRSSIFSESVIRYNFQNGPAGRRNQRELRTSNHEFLRNFDSDSFGGFPKKRGSRTKTRNGWVGTGEPTRNWIAEAQEALINSL